MSALESPFAGGPLPGVGGGGDPFGGLTTFGFSIPQGSAAELEAAASSCRNGGQGLVLQGNGIAQGSKIAVGGWQGEAQAAFAERAGQASSVLLANADAFTNAGTTLDRLAGELWRAQKLTRQAAKDCQSYQQQLNAAQQAADQHAQDAQNLSAQAQLAAHPHAQAKLNHQATLACDQAQAAQGQANQARAQLESAQKQGRDADHAYQQQADEVKGQIQAAGAEIRTIPHLPTPIPINITPADINLAKKMLHGAGNLANAAKAATNPALLKRLAGQNLTPAAVAAFLHDLQVAERDAPKPQRGSLIDAAGGFLNTFTFGALSFGNPNTARYRGGELAAMIPADPDALVVDRVDGGSDAAKLAEDLGDDGGETAVGDMGAMNRLEFQASPKHPDLPAESGQRSLDNSLQLSDNSTRRVGVDYENDQYVVFDETYPGQGVFHGHYRTWNELSQPMQAMLRRSGLSGPRGQILTGEQR